ncbi:hypothetical protein KIH74_26665 [Kineosporia sp. J2-2]|uniref:DUF5709 domain-containing protein n=1 Tax=Kineosporia corallincola TaxID=2835133 RepID=A0ABS5TN88_9ACTN|nr:hypothetical protein [Kineosporia corallincola]MBT0772557.1 hypothetical protein [Kineosporia corallincola]
MADPRIPAGAYQGDGDELELLDGVDPEPVFEPALIDTDDESMALAVDPPQTGDGPEPAEVEVEDTLMAGDGYGDVL